MIKSLQSGLLLLTVIPLLLAFATLRIHTDRMNFILFRYASIYMMSAVLILALQRFI